MHERAVSLDAVTGKALFRCPELLYAGFDAERLTRRDCAAADSSMDAQSVFPYALMIASRGCSVDRRQLVCDRLLSLGGRSLEGFVKTSVSIVTTSLNLVITSVCTGKFLL